MNVCGCVLFVEECECVWCGIVVGFVNKCEIVGC